MAASDFSVINPFTPGCPRKGHTYLNKPASESCRIFSVLSMYDLLVDTSC